VPITFGGDQGALFGGLNPEFHPDQSADILPLSTFDSAWPNQQNQLDAWQLSPPRYQDDGSYQNPSLGAVLHQQGYEPLQPEQQASYPIPGSENWQYPEVLDWTQSDQQGDFQWDRWSGQYGDQHR
jgi:hypothetical protein